MSKPRIEISDPNESACGLTRNALMIILLILVQILPKLPIKVTIDILQATLLKQQTKARFSCSYSKVRRLFCYKSSKMPELTKFQQKIFVLQLLPQLLQIL